ncbi:hypothetical protein NP233_g10908 [Leucocoprinus birnbaumii]|uniref:Nephrocystin 3-like N-terminal domain-containing protein n=1 Tax=Leucocoprinus birnbaumii TaxID=56174 RepID=A0AAD5VJW1_9AGAR|nr:hypothetical protein NP233_g10908 [Leucocoprinus birnbaumii]
MVFDSFIDSLRAWTASESTPPPGFFDHASNFVVQQQELTHNVNFNTYNMITSGNTALNHLAPYTNPDAAVDSSARWPPPQCHPDTRVTIRAELMSWLHNATREWNFIWLWGSAGCGKSAVAQTFAEKCLALGCLGAAFFFSRPNKRNDPKTVVPSLAYQLATHCPPYKAIITSRLSDDPQLLTKVIPVQFKKLIIEPFSELQQHGLLSAEQPFIIILDGLDECEGESIQCEIVKQIEEAVRLKKDLPLIWMVCSRPEAHLKHTFARIPICNPEELPIDDECQTDVERYLISGLSELQVKYDIDPLWPPVEKVNAVTESGDGHFIFSAVALGFIGDEEYGNPVERLDTLIAFLDDVERDGALNPLAKLDALYMHILTEIPAKIFPTTWRILAHLIFAHELGDGYSEFLYKSAQALSNFVDIYQSTFYSALRKLHSIIAVPPPERVATTPLRFYHASFQDYLVDANRSGRFVVEKKQALIDITKTLFHWHEVDAAHFHTQDGPYKNRGHNHAALPGLKWTSGLDVKSPVILQILVLIRAGKVAGKVSLMMTNQKPIKPALFPLTWHMVSHCKQEYVLMVYGSNREYVLMGYGSKSVILWFTLTAEGNVTLDCLTCDQEPSQS